MRQHTLANVDMSQPMDRTHWSTADQVLWLKALPSLRGSQWYDLTSFGGHGTLTGMDPLTDWVSPDARLGLDFAGYPQYVTIPNNRRYSFCDSATAIETGETIYWDNPFSVCAWIRPRSWPFRIIGKGLHASVSCEWLFVVAATGVLATGCYSQTTADSIGCNSTANLNSYLNSWIHVAMTYTGVPGAGCFALYLNGTPFAGSYTSAGSYDSMRVTTDPLEIGRIWGTLAAFGGIYASYFADGPMDDLRLFSRALAPEEWAWIYRDSRTQRYEALRRTDAPCSTFASAYVPPTIACTLGQVTVTPLAAVVSQPTTFDCTTPAVQVASLTATVTATHAVECSCPTVIVAALTPVVSAGTTFSCTTASVTVAPLNATVVPSLHVNCTAAAIAVAAINATVLGPTVLRATCAHVVVAGQQAFVSVGLDIECSAPAAIAVAPLAATVEPVLAINATKPNIVVAAQTCAITSSTTIRASAAAVTVTSYPATIPNTEPISAAVAAVVVEALPATLLFTPLGGGDVFHSPIFGAVILR